MISKYEMIDYFKKNGDKFKFYYNKETDCLHDKIDNTLTIKMDDFLQDYKKKNGESFECINDEHIFCWSLLRCTECGTVVFYYYDEKYEPNFKCPTCTDYKTSYEYWTKEQIEQDEDRQKCIQFHVNSAKWEEERHQREKKRHGKNDDQLLVIKKRTKKHSYTFELKCNDIMESHIKGLMLKIGRYTLDENGFGTNHKEVRIPLGITDLLFEIRLNKHRKERLKTQ